MADRLGMTGAWVGRGDGLIGTEIAKYGGMNVTPGRAMTRGTFKPVRSRAREQRWPLASRSLRAKQPQAQPLSETPFYSSPGDRGRGNATQAGRYATLRRNLFGKADSEEEFLYRRARQQQAWRAAGPQPLPAWLKDAGVQEQAGVLFPKPRARAKKKVPAAAPGWQGQNRREADRRVGPRRVDRRQAERRVIKLDTTMDRANADQLVRRYGRVGSLPKDLSRSERMRAYEARYIAAGGPKAERWQRHKDVSEGVRNASLATATATAGAMVARGTRPARAVARLGPLQRVKPRHLERTAWGAAATGGAGELYGEYADQKRRSNASAPAGVAASALRRMRAYTPED